MKFGIIGGTGLDDPEIMKDFQETELITKFGKPSSLLKSGKINGTDIVIIARHGVHHQIPPSKVNNRANIMALKESGVTHIIATSAAGSLREGIGIGDLVFPDQFIDFTRHRAITFNEDFTDGIVHTPMAEPFDPRLRNALLKTAALSPFTFHSTGTVISIEGPRFSTKAESHMFRLWGADVINMSVAPEVILANEAGIPYACIVISTDYDCWKEDVTHVTWDEVLKVFSKNIENVIQLIINTIKDF